MTEPPHHNLSPMALSGLEIAPQPSPSKKKRNLPGMPDPDAEVVALSPKTLLATNRFVCEICNKGFQRDQNLQLHRRGHNLPWKLRQRDTTDIRKKVYVCPEPTCVHHNPDRALGDLTGIKKHFSRKHGEKKLKCERCSKKYAVKSDWKAHMKTCGTREYRCACGALFSRRDGFASHRAFCDALAEESAKTQTLGTGKADVAPPSSSPPPPPLTPSTSVVSPTLSIQSSEIIAENAARQSPPPSNTTACLVNAATTVTPSSSTICCNFFASVLASAAAPNSTFPNLTAAIAAIEQPTSLTLSSPLYLSHNDPPLQDPHRYTSAFPQPAALSATALLQKAAEMGAAASNASSLLRGFGLPSSSSSPAGQDDSINDPIHWSRHVKQEKNLSTLADHNLGLGLPCGNHNAAGFADVMIMGSPPGPGPFGGNHQPMMTRDLLGLGIGGGGASRGGLSSLLTSFGGGSFDSSGDGGV